MTVRRWSEPRIRPRLAWSVVVIVMMLTIAGCRIAASESQSSGLWTLELVDDSDPDVTVADIAASGRFILAVGSNSTGPTVWRRAETAPTWDRIDNDLGNGSRNLVPRALASDGRQFVLLASEHADRISLSLWRSSDGESWAEAATPEKPAQDVYAVDIDWSGTRFVALAIAPIGGDTLATEALVLTSADGETWKRVVDPAMISKEPRDMTHLFATGDRIAAIGFIPGEGSQLLTNGASWENRIPKGLESMMVRAAALGPNLSLGGCTSPAPDDGGVPQAAMWMSPDDSFIEGTSVGLEDGPEKSCVEDLTAAEDSLVAVGFVGGVPASWTSDGPTWTRESLLVPATLHDMHFRAIARLGSLYAAVADAASGGAAGPILPPARVAFWTLTYRPD